MKVNCRKISTIQEKFGSFDFITLPHTFKCRGLKNPCKCDGRASPPWRNVLVF